ncbi:helix-turn-helix domain-containing protein [Leptospira kanakyensis]|uniref:Helix-turn-helix domain-containing protein n=1 Tax=Leptospira kanakyensis TaxID=2484968 RepID=A0A6N4Q6R9_9LEPT|nr:helix-turn-helix domain-containing protein [Leptospira kanakyensis]TGK54598.1 helix-turn-helix domain-containing protein [Leptospira kanakyensis]TGK59175.1 helix-turn-helix domain-containing protein [Leptospira kanakyensis]TGK75356.1 helix-turn-helix domain-containing protein [Leptospira kanakyensis]
MTDIIDSGVWAELSHAAKTLYPVLLKFSDYNFKPVWPNTETLMRLTGFKTKKSIVSAKKELTHAGLLYQVPGSGRTSTRYHFSFHYEGSRITPLGDTNRLPRDSEMGSSEGSKPVGKGGADGTPNHINITISNTNNVPAPPSASEMGKEKEEKKAFETLVELFGPEIALEAYKKAVSLHMESNTNYIQSLCRELVSSQRQEVLKTEQKYPMEELVSHPASWAGFLSWASKELTQSSWNQLDRIQVQTDGNVIIVTSPLQGHLRQIVQMYFTEKVKPAVLVVFSEKEEGSRLSEIR